MLRYGDRYLLFNYRTVMCTRSWQKVTFFQGLKDVLTSSTSKMTSMLISVTLGGEHGKQHVLLLFLRNEEECRKSQLQLRWSAHCNGWIAGCMYNEILTELIPKWYTHKMLFVGPFVFYFTENYLNLKYRHSLLWKPCIFLIKQSFTRTSRH
jgi:hypothetical protein